VARIADGICSFMRVDTARVDRRFPHP